MISQPRAELPPPTYSGKVRDLYEIVAPAESAGNGESGDARLLMVASDRISAFDVVLPTEIPDKGKILTQLSLWWFEQLADMIDNHVIASDVADYPAPFTGRPELVGRSMLVRRLDMVMVECVARAYLSGSGTVQYDATRSISGVALPDGLVEGSRLPETIFTPTTKGGPAGHDEPMTYDEMVSEVGADRAAELRTLTVEVLDRGRAICEPRGILLADTKVEFGMTDEGRVILADEVLTPDSSRFWPADRWRPGQAQPSFDKQPLRDWLRTLDWDRTSPGPELPDEVVEATRNRYVTAYQKITGNEWR
ncbi:MAG TPA: phosphoribosylaminoimidazolesuccinocarboxamide synthase [Micromonosporaceae bacterium]|nr:phosphoribosylaminoimidazolesuccinocarboxamide synthase [Micromonosporaceae bacterium]